MSIGFATVVTLSIILRLPGQEELITHSEQVENIGMCFAIARELVTRAEEGILKQDGGSFTATCSVKVPPTQEH